MEIEREGLLLEISKGKVKSVKERMGTKEMGKSELDKLGEKGVNLGNEKNSVGNDSHLEISESHLETSEEK